MKYVTLVAFSALGLLLSEASGQTPIAPNPADQQLLAAIKQLQAQQSAIAENQAKIDAKVALVAEAMRVAKIYSSRGGH